MYFEPTIEEMRPPLDSYHDDATVLLGTMTLLDGRAPELVETFYATLFRDYPYTRPLFPDDMEAQQAKLLAALVTVVSGYDEREQLVPTLRQLGAAHVRFGVQPAHFAAVGICLLAALEQTLGDLWTPTQAGAWQRAYEYTARAMIEGIEGAIL